MSDVTVAGAQILALLGLLGGVISWLFRLAYGGLKEDRDFWRKSYQEQTDQTAKTLRIVADGMTTLLATDSIHSKQLEAIQQDVASIQNLYESRPAGPR